MAISRRQAGAFAFLALGLATLPASAETSDQAAVAEAVAALTRAMLAADRAKLGALVSDSLSYGHSGGVIQDKKDFVEVIASRKTVYKSIELSKQTVAVAGNNAIVRHAWESESGAGDGKWNVSKIGVLQVWQKEAGGWRLLARQAFKV
ncbi:MAG: nuclear transport factor 2 family protein [Reyranella sp.]|uniref:nuclear transport factor 2 family protein n=1 Tax=Reyranella sp. TaxID=1929291 RepID=UPI001AC30B93|nr:nuclear transport factor 2 family protein [Reyranella sp.]MBN9090090.1 nuclear transport factor 2 family protein [Reyranella sp.]